MSHEQLTDAGNYLLVVLINVSLWVITIEQVQSYLTIAATILTIVWVCIQIYYKVSKRKRFYTKVRWRK